MIVEATSNDAEAGDEDCCGEPEELGSRKMARKPEEGVLKVREASPGRDGVQVIPPTSVGRNSRRSDRRRCWRPRRGAGGAQKRCSRSGGAAVVCRSEKVVSASKPSLEKKTDAIKGKAGKTDRKHASKGLGSKNRLPRCSGRCLLPESTSRGGYRRRVLAISVAPCSGAAGHDGRSSTVLGCTHRWLADVQMM